MKKEFLKEHNKAESYFYDLEEHMGKKIICPFGINAYVLPTNLYEYWGRDLDHKIKEQLTHLIDDETHIRTISQILHAKIDKRIPTHLPTRTDDYAEPLSLILPPPPHAGKAFSLPVILESIATQFNPDIEMFQYFGVWHELAHTLTRKEANADYIAASMLRWRYQDEQAIPFIQYMSDCRALRNVKHLKNFDNFKKYPWGIVDALDQAQKISSEEIQNAHPKDFASFAQINFDARINDTITALSYIHQHAKSMYKKQHNYLPAHEKAAHSLIERTDDQNVIDIAKRFSRACARLYIGESAYTYKPTATIHELEF